MVTKIYFIRHCQSTGNIDRKFQGRFDAQITPAGAEQLELLGLRFRNQQLDGIYTSPLKRARATAEAIARYHPDLKVREEPDFTEIDCGEMENLPLTELAEKFPQVARNWDSAPDLCVFPGGETMLQVYERVNRALDRIIMENPGKTLAVITHGGVLRNIFARVSYGKIEGIRNTEVFGNTGVSLLLAEDGTSGGALTGALRWAWVNDLTHLPEEMRRPPIKFAFFQKESEENLI